MLGDPRLGAEQQQRFLPSRFDVRGNAVDGRGLSCTGLACPRCHLPVPRALLEFEPFFVSILGAPACGKSFYLAALTWELRRILSQQLALTLTDVDPVANRTLNEYEEHLFLHPQADDLVPVSDLIFKTQETGDLYDVVRYGNQEVMYPRPFLFSLRAGKHHPHPAAASHTGRLLCLYDNAGESFQPGRESTRSPVTQHLAHSRLLLFLFDPLQDVRFRNACARGGALPTANYVSRQDTVLLEAAARVRRIQGLASDAPIDRPLIVVLTKSDAWSGLLAEDLQTEPCVPVDSRSGLDRERIERCSGLLRSLLLRISPEIVTTAEGFSREVVYVAISALGASPIHSPHHKAMCVRPGSVRPSWVTVPLLYGLSRCLPGLIPLIKRRTTASLSGRGPLEARSNGLARSVQMLNGAVV